MVLREDGSATFVGGFQHYNPVRWRSGRSGQSFVLVLPRKAEWPVTVIEELSRSAEHPLLSFSQSERSMELNVLGDGERRHVNVLGEPEH